MRLRPYARLAATVLLVALPCSAASAQVLPGGQRQNADGASSYTALVRQNTDDVTARWKEAWDRRDPVAMAAL